jgi:hypothetical protein
LSAATVTTLLVLPAIFAIALRNHTIQSPSIHPDDPASEHHEPSPAAESFAQPPGDAPAASKAERETP